MSQPYIPPANPSPYIPPAPTVESEARKLGIPPAQSVYTVGEALGIPQAQKVEAMLSRAGVPTETSPVEQTVLPPVQNSFYPHGLRKVDLPPHVARLTVEITPDRTEATATDINGNTLQVTMYEKGFSLDFTEGDASPTQRAKKLKDQEQRSRQRDALAHARSVRTINRYLSGK